MNPNIKDFLDSLKVYSLKSSTKANHIYVVLSESRVTVGNRVFDGHVAISRFKSSTSFRNIVINLFPKAFDDEATKYTEKTRKRLTKELSENIENFIFNDAKDRVKLNAKSIIDQYLSRKFKSFSTKIVYNAIEKAAKEIKIEEILS